MADDETTPDAWLLEVKAYAPSRLHDAADAIAGEATSFHVRHEKMRNSPRWRYHALDLIDDGMLLSLGGNPKETDRMLHDANLLAEIGWLTNDEDGSITLSVPECKTLQPHPRFTGVKGYLRRRENINYRVRMRVYLRDQWRCWLCGGKTTLPPLPSERETDWSPCLDHVYPHSFGGNDMIDNLRTAHNWCNIVRVAGEPPNKKIMSLRVINRESLRWADKQPF